MQVKDLFGDHHQTVFLEAVAAAAATTVFPLMAMPFAARVKSVHIIPQAAVSGDGTDTKNLNVQDRGAAGTGTTEIANLDLAAGVDLVAFDRRQIGTITGDGRQMAAGSVLALQVEDVGAGVAIPASQIEVVFEPDPNPA